MARLEILMKFEQKTNWYCSAGMLSAFHWTQPHALHLRNQFVRARKHISDKKICSAHNPTFAKGQDYIRFISGILLVVARSSFADLTVRATNPKCDGICRRSCVNRAFFNTQRTLKAI
jgi:hypothetical protein